MSTLDLRFLAATVRANQVGSFCDLASIAVLTYDYFLTLDLEINLIWGTPWNIGKVLYFLTKYSVFIESGLLLFCKSFLIRKSCFCTNMCYSVSNVWVVYILGCWSCRMYSFIQNMGHLGTEYKIRDSACTTPYSIRNPCRFFDARSLVAQSPIPKIQSCFLMANHDILIFIDYALILLFETIILVLTLVKGVAHYRNSSSSLVATLYKDGLLYYIYLTSFSLGNVFFLVFLVDTGASLILMQRAFHSILTGRILLHLRTAVIRDRRTASSLRSTPNVLTSIFARPHLEQLVIGADTWFHESASSAAGTFSDEFEMR
ncbi:hypothetical protein K439DRAFT_169662 [Ramaria rubella]|nr:hypothetical protein K439DRAFT_169662 [Ramaria rubella]